jgi:ketosteroid isomerase-like protein
MALNGLLRRVANSPSHKINNPFRRWKFSTTYAFARNFSQVTIATVRALLKISKIRSKTKMRAKLLAVAVLGLLGLLRVPAIAQEKSDESAIRALEAKWANAYQQRQIGELAALLADDYVITTEDGNTYSKVGFISFNSGPLRVDLSEFSDLKVHIHQNVAVVTGIYHESGASSGKPYDYRDRVTDVWIKNGAKWQLLASHYSLSSKL